MTKNRLEKLEEFQKHTVERLDRIIELVEKLCALSVSDQLLNECVAPDGTPRTAEGCASIVEESFHAGLCLSQEMEEAHRGFRYSRDEFFIDDEDEDDEPHLNIPSQFSD